MRPRSSGGGAAAARQASVPSRAVRVPSSASTNASSSGSPSGSTGSPRCRAARSPCRARASRGRSGRRSGCARTCRLTVRQSRSSPSVSRTQKSDPRPSTWPAARDGEQRAQLLAQRVAERVEAGVGGRRHLAQRRQAGGHGDRVPVVGAAVVDERRRVGSKTAITSARPPTAPTGKPPPMILPRQVRSGGRPARGRRRGIPAGTSAPRRRRAGCRARASPRAGGRGSRGGGTRPSPRGSASTITAASEPGFSSIRRRTSGVVPGHHHHVRRRAAGATRLDARWPAGRRVPSLGGRPSLTCA